MLLKVYGAISQIFEPGVFTDCTPIFVNHHERGKYTKFYRLDDNGQVIEVDLNEYGTPVFLPAGKKKANDGKEYFIIYQSSKNYTLNRYCTYSRDHIAISTEGEIPWIPKSLSMGIKFPDKFVCVLAPDIDKDTLKNMIS